MIFVLDRHEKVRAIFTNNGSPGSCPYYDDVMKEDLSTGVATYEFRVPTNHPNADLIEEGGYVVRADLDGNLRMFTIIQVEETHAEQSEKYVYAEDAGLELLNDIVRPNTYYSVNIDQALDIILQDTRWERGRTDYLGVQKVVIEDYQTVVSALQMLGELYGGELSFRVKMENGEVIGRYVDIVKQRGTVTKKRFVFNKDILNIKRTVDISELATALIGIGKGDADGNYTTFRNVSYSKSNGDPFDKPLNQDWVGDPDALQRYGVQGKHLFGVFQYETDNAEELLNATWNELQKRKNPKITYDLDVALLERLAGLEHEKVRLGDTVYVIDETFSPPLYLEARVIQLETSFSDPSKDRCILGNIQTAKSNITAQMRALQSKLLKKETTWDEAKARAEEAIATSTEAKSTAETANQTATTAQQTASNSQQMAQQAQQTAQAAEQKAETAKQEAMEYADQAASTAEQNAKQYAEQYTQQYAEQKAPSATPAAPTNFSATGAFKKVILKWDIDTSKTVAYYELYASQTAGFTPNSANLLWKGKASGYTHDADVNQTWYYRLRAVNAYGQAGAFTNEVSASTVKIISDDILFGAVNAQHIADLAVTAQKLADGSITTTKIADGAVNTAKIVDDAITNAKIAAGAVGNTELDRTSANKIQIASNDIIDGAITTLKIASNAVDSTKLANLAVTAAKIVSGAVDNSKIASGAIDNSKLANLAVDAAKLADDAVTNAKIADNAVASAQIQDAAIVSAKIANLAVGTGAIQDGAITNAKIANVAVDSAKIANAAITSAHIANAAVGAAAIATAAIGTAHIADGAITDAKITNLDASKITSGYIDVNRIEAKTITTDKLVVADLTNLCVNPVFDGGSDREWSGVEAVVNTTTGVPANAPTTYVGKQSQRDGCCGSFFPVNEGDKFYIEVWCATSNSTQKFGAGLNFQKEDGTNTWVRAFQTTPIGSWTKFSGEVTVPAGFTKARVWTQIDAFSNFGDWYFTKVVVRRKANSELIVDGAITASKVAANTITAGSAIIADGAITSAKIANAAIGTAAIQDGAITNAKIANAAIDSAKIANAAITSAHIASAAVGNAAIQNVAITNAKIATAAVGTTQIQDAAITNAKIANLAVDDAKIASLHGSKITASSIT
ncbi:phage tail spike protein, partial [Geobacillus kaustophilus]|uniref:phage tail spike protein n=1 Tax=Geobacillus kaustophilus TaxID=1462 RepID=UPI0018CE08C9